MWLLVEWWVIVLLQIFTIFLDYLNAFQRLDGIDIQELNVQWLRSCFGVVSQEPVLFDLTIAENIAYALENVSTEEIIEAATKANIHQFIQQLPQASNQNIAHIPPIKPSWWKTSSQIFVRADVDQ